MELWDRDIIGSSDSLGAAEYPLSSWLKECYVKQRSVKPFELIHKAQRGDDLEEKKTEHQIEVGGEGGEEGDDTAAPAVEEKALPVPGKEHYADDLLNLEEEEVLEEKAGDDDDDDNTDDDDDDDDGNQGESKALMGKKKDKKHKKPDNPLDVFKELVGLPVSHDDAEWLQLSVMDVESAQIEENGQLYISIELVPMEQAEASPVGNGRSEPNTNPFLPPPQGG